MLPLEFKDNKYYIGKVEVLPFPIAGPTECTLGYIGKVPPLEQVLVKLVSEASKQNIDLTRANCYFLIIKREEVVPEQVIRDDKVSESRKKFISVQFFKAVPATPGKKAALEEMFSTSI